MAYTFLKAGWRKLILANYEVSPDILLPLLPEGTELDIWNGRCYVSLVGFLFVDTMVLGIKIPFHVNFEEVNLRFYVKHFDGKVWKRGVVFVKEIVPKWAITFVANNLYGEKYETRTMGHVWEILPDKMKISYWWQTGKKKNKVLVSAVNEAVEIAEGSEEEFITEHYWGYTKRKQSTDEYGVEHPRWVVYPVLEYEIDVSFEGNYGSRFGFLDAQKPLSVFLAEGSDILVKSGAKL